MSMLLTLFFITLFLSILSGLLFLFQRVPLGYVRFHIGIISLPAFVSLMALFNNSVKHNIGPLHLDSLAWLMACFVLTIGVVIQRFSVRYLLGDRSYRKYFILFTIITGAASVSWLSDDLRLMVCSWGITLIGLTILISLNKNWKVTRAAARRSSRIFAGSWVALLLAVIWLFQTTGSWKLSLALTPDRLAHIDSWEKTGINLLLVVAVMIPAAQWPFQKWLIESVVAPTPVSAIMHAGIVNAGGIILTRFALLLNGDIAQILLLVLASISVVIGTGISLVQVDYKRQLVGSTIAQMGFMLIQCALGAYLAAIIHLVLHGLFKATLFLQSGSALQRHEGSNHVKKRPSYLWIVAGYGLGVLLGVAYWQLGSGGAYTFVNALILGWSLSFSWTQLVAFGKGRIDRLAGLFVLAGSSIVYFLLHSIFDQWLHTAVYQSIQLPSSIIVMVICLLILGSIIGVLASRNHSSAFFARLYLLFVKVGEGEARSTESHPYYLKQYLS
ncbi:NADH dehydrogenase subunit 5 [Bacillus dakarensis]|uniref:NADH dehydrogenase subunit 5 n=1 Tax=Robertmurraya dakarensis TaxID=1926278 RepID=UPI001F3A182E|nr:NADH dehydrogenase subunit 5 [Bacillus dakarensis]